MSLSNIFLIIVALIVIERYLETFAKRKKQMGAIKHGWTLTFMFILHNCILVGTLIEYFLVHRELNIVFSLFGLTICCIGLLLRNWAIKSLGEYWSIHIEIREPHPILKEGLYRHMRHPAYLGIAFEVLGFPLILNSIYTFCFSLFVYIPILLVRQYLEEKEMIYLRGDSYLNYREETWSFLPFPGKKSLMNFVRKNKVLNLVEKLLTAC